jgi:hypothetical protein
MVATMRGNFGFSVWRHIARIRWLEGGDRKTNLLNKAAVSLSCYNLQLNQNTLCCLHILGFLGHINERACQYFMDDSNTIDLIPKNVGKDMVSGGRKQRVDNLR